MRIGMVIFAEIFLKAPQINHGAEMRNIFHKTGSGLQHISQTFLKKLAQDLVPSLASAGHVLTLKVTKTINLEKRLNCPRSRSIGAV